jgi:hypothetical protein
VEPALKIVTPLMLVAALTLIPGMVQAEVTAIAREIGGDVVIQASGTLNLDEWSPAGVTNARAQIDPSAPAVVVGAGFLEPVDVYDTPPASYSRPDNFGAGGFLFAQQGTGDLFGFQGPDSIFVPQDYTSGDPLSGTALLQSQTFFALEMEVGTYTWSWGEGATADSFTLIVTTDVESNQTSWGKVKALFR